MSDSDSGEVSNDGRSSKSVSDGGLVPNNDISRTSSDSDSKSNDDDKKRNTKNMKTKRTEINNRKNKRKNNSKKNKKRVRTIASPFIISASSIYLFSEQTLFTF